MLLDFLCLTFDEDDEVMLFVVVSFTRIEDVATLIGIGGFIGEVVTGELLIESVSSSPDDDSSLESEQSLIGLYGGIVLTLPPFFYNKNIMIS